MPAEVLRRISWGFRRYLISDDPKLTHKHTPPLEGIPWKYAQVMRAAMKITRHLMGFRQNDGPFNHDLYLKAYALEQQAGKTPPPMFRNALLDEAQDPSSILVGIAERFQVPLIIVGDTYQSIYAF